MNFDRIIISRTDSIGDVVLTLPLAGLLKQKYPDTEIIFLGRAYTKEVILACEHVNSFMDWDSLSDMADKDAIEAFRSSGAEAIFHIFPRSRIARLAKKARIPIRLGTTGRLYHINTCNKLVRLSRRRSSLHEAQLNLMLVRKYTGEGITPLGEIASLYGLSRVLPAKNEFEKLIDPKRMNLILHPKSKGSAREWGLPNFNRLIQILPVEKYNIFISGTEEEGRLIKGSGIFDHVNVHNMTGKMSLSQLLAFINICDGLVAASTGPLHLAASLGKIAIGIYPPIKPMHPGRWAPIGEKAGYLVEEKECEKCRKQGSCECMESIRAEQVKEMLEIKSQ